MEIKVLKLKVVHKPPQPPCIWFQVPLCEALNDFLSLADKILDRYVLRLVRKSEKSLTANAYMWQLCEKIAKKIGVTKVDVYRAAIREVGAFVDGVFSKSDAESVKESWCENGIGWFAEPHGVFGEMITVRLYKGSSIYDGEQMRRLIDYIVEEAKGLGIDTMTPKEIERLNQLWATGAT